MKDILVSISCITYNHKNYIRQCLEGFLMQKTNFAFEILIHDDASTDGTTEIIQKYEKQYPSVIKPVYQTENQYSKGVSISATFNFPRVKGKYVAICEGDDYWTDPLKLQKQFDFLEKKPDFGLVYTNTICYHQSSGQFIKQKTSQISKLEDLLVSNKISTLTTCFRSDLWKDYQKNAYPKLPKFPFGDYPMWIYFFSKTKFHYLQDFTAVYRVLDNSASHSTLIENHLYFRKKVYECKIYMLNSYFKKEKDKLGYAIKQNYAFDVLHSCIKFNSKSSFFNNQYLIKDVKDKRLRFIYYLHKINFSFFSYFYRKSLWLRKERKGKEMLF